MDIAFRLAFWLLLSIAVPATLMAIPLYLRHMVYSTWRSAVVSSDYRLIDQHVSTVWCKGLELTMNTTFNAFLLGQMPRYENSVRTFLNVRHFNFRMGEREFLGFFLPKRSRIVISTCARLDSAKITLVKGKRLMRRCIQPGYKDSDEENSNQSTDEDDAYSSWSSSEEATDELKCMKTLLNRTLTPSIQCTKDSWTPKDVLSYTTSETDYYYVVFSSMNPIRKNDIYAKIQIDKAVYDTRNYLRKCFNVTRCSLPFSFASEEQVVLEVPDRSIWVADIFFSECQPRTLLYFPFYVAIPISILIFAFRGNSKKIIKQ